MVRKLHIGGATPHPSWEILNILPGPHVDHVANANDLSMFEDGTFAAVYASHIAEHLDYAGELQAALKEWCRVLAPDGKLYISVPDLDILSRLLLARDQLSISERFDVMRMMFGGHADEHDYHLVGLNQDFLVDFLAGAGFRSVQRVEDFGLFDDTSNTRIKGVLVSLNLIATRQPVPAPAR